MESILDTTVLLSFVALGGSIGALGRYGFGELARSWWRFPGWMAILAANLLGCVLIGVFWSLLDSGPALGPGDDELLRGLLLTGVCGSLTTFSTFSRDTLMLYYEGRSGTAALNVAASLVGGVGGTALALLLGGAW